MRYLRPLVGRSETLSRANRLHFLERNRGANELGTVGPRPLKLGVEVSAAPLGRLFPVVVRPASLVVLYDGVNKGFMAVFPMR